MVTKAHGNSEVSSADLDMILHALEREYDVMVVWSSWVRERRFYLVGRCYRRSDFGLERSLAVCQNSWNLLEPRNLWGRYFWGAWELYLQLENGLGAVMHKAPSTPADVSSYVRARRG